MSKVFRDYDQKQLDEQYNNQRFVTNVREVLDRMASRSAQARKDFAHRTLQYGNSPDETLDFFPASARNAPTHLFIHGGGWRLSSKDDVSYLAQAFVPAGANYVAINYALAPSVTLDEIVRQCRAAVVWLHNNAELVGCDRNRIFASGHSSGGHLAAMLLSTNWQDFGLIPYALKGGGAFSGMYDLEPVRLSFRNSYLNLDTGAVERNSPIRHILNRPIPLIVGWGELESDEFKRQGDEFARAWMEKGNLCETFEFRNLNHFEVADELINPAGPVLRRLLYQMQLA